MIVKRPERKYSPLILVFLFLCSCSLVLHLFNNNSEHLFVENLSQEAVGYGGMSDLADNCHHYEDDDLVMLKIVPAINTFAFLFAANNGHLLIAPCSYSPPLPPPKTL
jgi:hypothetical protein